MFPYDLFILCDSIALLAEYSEWIHVRIESLYTASFHSEEIVQKIGGLILDRDGLQALWISDYAIDQIMVYLLRTVGPRLLGAADRFGEEIYLQRGVPKLKNHVAQGEADF